MIYYFSRRASRIGARQGAAKVFRQSLVLSALLVTIPSAGHSQVTECRSEKGDGYPWAWREIDGRRCWYKGKAGMDKKLLRWADSSKAPAVSKGSPSNRRPPSLIDQYGEREQLLHSYWPPLPGATEVIRGKRL